MRHQTNRKYADRKKRNRKYQSQKAYRKEQKRKTGWRARWDKFTDRLANIFGIGFLILLPILIIYGIFFLIGVSLSFSLLFCRASIMIRNEQIPISIK